MRTKKSDGVQFGSEEHIAAIKQAYGIRPEIAKKVVKEFEDGTKDWDVNYYEKCKRLVSLLENPTPKAISPREGWKRDRSY
jgi:phosphosulfolactate synthase (CoM biosynthesis protein A)